MPRRKGTADNVGQQSDWNVQVNRPRTVDGVCQKTRKVLQNRVYAVDDVKFSKPLVGYQFTYN